MRYRLLFLALCSFMATGQVYKVVKEDGTVLYTDDPIAGSEEITFSDATQNVSDSIAPPAPPASQQPASASSQPPTPDYQVTISSPEPEATVRDNNGNVTIRAQKSPADVAAQYQLIFDGKARHTNNNGVFALTGVNRGAHTFHIKLLDNKGKTLASSEEQTLYLHQASVLINNN